MRTEPLPAMSSVALVRGCAGSLGEMLEYALANVEFLRTGGGNGPAAGEVR